MRYRYLFLTTLSLASLAAQDKLGRDNPRSTVTAFLQACRRQDYDTAAQYIDLRYLPQQNRTAQGPEVARKLEDALNAAPRFTVFELTQNPEGTRQYVAGFTQNRQTYSIDLERTALQPNGPLV